MFIQTGQTVYGSMINIAGGVTAGMVYASMPWNLKDNQLVCTKGEYTGTLTQDGTRINCLVKRNDKVIFQATCLSLEMGKLITQNYIMME